MNKELKQKPFHNIEFPKVYNDGNGGVADFKRIKNMASGRKVKVYVTPEIFDKIVEVYRTGASPQEIAKAVDVSIATANKYIIKARQRVAQEQANHKEENGLKVKVQMLEQQLLDKEKGAERYKKELSEAQKTILKLQAKVDVLTDLMRGR